MVSDWASGWEEAIVARRSRVEAGKAILEVAKQAEKGFTERAVAKQLSIPKSTAHERVARFKFLDVGSKTFEFFTSEEGVSVLQRLVDSLILFVHEVAGCGLRIAESVLRASGLDRFAASSPSYLGNRAVRMEGLILTYGKLEKTRLSLSMPLRVITMLEDETWLRKMHLVAMDAVSGYIVVEQPAERRDGESWGSAVAKGLEGFNVKVVQVTSDEGKGLVYHAEVILGANHSPDLFHVQREISRGMAATLAAQIRSAEKKVAKEEAGLSWLRVERDAALKAERGPGRPVEWDRHVDTAAGLLAEARSAKDKAVERQNQFREAVRGMSSDYHAVDLDLESGTLRSPRELERRLRARFLALRAVIEDGELPEYAAKAVDKAERVLPDMVGTLSFVNGEWERFAGNLGLSSKAAWQIRARLIPAAYLEWIASRKRKEEQQPFLGQAAELILTAFSAGTELDSYSGQQKGLLLQKCREQALLFQRSSSPLEGRNGRLSQMHAVGRGVGERTLQVHTVLSNFLIERSDNTTAAERFFGNKPLDLIDWVFSRMPLHAASRKTSLAPLTPQQGVLVH